MTDVSDIFWGRPLQFSIYYKSGTNYCIEGQIEQAVIAFACPIMVFT